MVNTMAMFGQETLMFLYILRRVVEIKNVALNTLFLNGLVKLTYWKQVFV